MKKPFIFLSDFDGTMSRKDFYHLFIEEPHLHEFDMDLRRRYQKREITSFEYLNAILMELNRTEKEILNAIHSLPIDPGVVPLVERVKKNEGEFAVISAGADYYISPILTRIGLDVPLYSNRGEFQNDGITMSFPENEAFHSQMYGIAKEAVVEYLEGSYNTVLFAGDGSADFRAAKAADIRFAKGRLAERLDDAGEEYIPFDTFADISLFCENEFFNAIDEQNDKDVDIYKDVVEW